MIVFKVHIEIAATRCHARYAGSCAAEVCDAELKTTIWRRQYHVPRRVTVAVLLRWTGARLRLLDHDDQLDNAPTSTGRGIAVSKFTVSEDAALQPVKCMATPPHAPTFAQAIQKALSRGHSTSSQVRTCRAVSSCTFLQAAAASSRTKASVRSYSLMSGLASRSSANIL